MTCPLAFVDIETTGASPLVDRAIEIGIVRVEGENVREFSTLLDPDLPLPPFISELTGIDARALASAPSFYEVKDEVAELLEGCLFVAHNARFDFAFLKHEFKRYDMPFSPKQLCTVKLSRKLFPSFRKHDLSSIIERYNIECSARHRALDDARVLWDFYKIACQVHSEGVVLSAVDTISKRPSLPPRLAKKYIDSLPEAPGVYVFYDRGVTPLYIGKSVNVRDRVLSHFANDYNSAREMELTSLVESIDVHPTAGDLAAQLLESRMVKESQPLFNRQLRYTRKIVHLKKVVTPEGYFSCEILETDRIDASEIDDVLGVFRSKKQIRDFLSEIVRENSLCQKYLGLDKTNGACFAHQLGWCRGACKNVEKPISYNMRFSEAFSKRRIKSWPFAGPVIITESFESRENVLIVDRWCIIANVDGRMQDVEWENIACKTESNKQDSLYFDYDAYKILLRYVNAHPHVMKPLPPTVNMPDYFS